MEYNHGLAEKEFKKHWEKMRKVLEAEHTPKNVIEEIRKMERESFNRDRWYMEHTQSLEDFVEVDGIEDGDAPESPLMKKNMASLSTEYNTFGTNRAGWWLDNLQDPRLQKWRANLSKDDVVLIDMIYGYQYSQKECAVKLHITQAAISQRLNRILFDLYKK